MAGTALQRHSAQLMAKLYPAFSRRATQVCILSAALEKIESGNCIDPRTLAREALEKADPFGWVERSKTPNVGGNRLAEGKSELTGLLGGPTRSEKE